MNKRISLPTILIAVLLIMPLALVGNVAAHSVKSPHDFVTATIWGPETVDPAWCYDTASGELIFNVYETLVFYKVDRTLPPEQQGRTGEFVGDLATEWIVAGPVHPDAPLGTVSTFYFDIRGCGPDRNFEWLGDHWHETFPQFSTSWYTKEWRDSNHNGHIDTCDYLYIYKKFLGVIPYGGRWVHVYAGTDSPISVEEVQVRFHNGEYLTAADVEYSLERFLAFDRDGGPTWMFYEPLLGEYASDWSDPTWPTKIDNAIESNSTTVWMNVAIDFPALAFMQILAQSWCSIMPKTWAIAHDCWNGVYTNASMTAYYNPAISPLDDWPAGTGGRVEDGSAPYTLDTFNAVEQWYRLAWYPEYWQGWPAPECNLYGYEGSSSYAEGWLKTVTIKGIDEWGTRKAMFLAGDADFCYVPRQNMPEIITNYVTGMPWDEEEYAPGINCIPGLPTLQCDAFFFNYKITMAGNAHVGDGLYGETGIPSWFFNDTDLRKAFAYCFNYTEFILAVYMGEGYQPPSPGVQGLAFWEYTWDTNPDGSYPATPLNVDLDPPDTVLPAPYMQPPLDNGTVLPPNPLYYINTTKAIEYFKLAHADDPAGSVWDVGFSFDILYNTGNTARRISALMMKEVVESLGNTKFHISVYEVDWPTFLADEVARKLTLFRLGWLADYPDPHNFFFPFMHSIGTFSAYSSYSDPHVDDLIEAGILTTVDDERRAIYWELCNIYFNDAPSLAILQPVGRHWTRDWVEGWYYNPIYPGDFYYHIWKGYKGDVNKDYVVDIFDLVTVAAAYGTVPGDAKWNAAADVIVSGEIDIFDLVTVAAQYG
jgi:peptide/nickel transport system substrate-binding protein